MKPWEPFVFAIVLVMAAMLVPASDAKALDCSGGSCGVRPARLFVPIARAPVGIFRAGKAIAAHRREKRQAGELPRQRLAKGIAAVRPVRRAARGVAWLLVGRRG